MGVHFAAIFDHRLDEAGIASLSARLGVLEPICAEMTDYYQRWFDLPRPWEPWTVMSMPPFQRLPRLRLEGGAGFSITVGNRSVYVHHVERFYNFLSQETPQTLLRRFCRDFAGVLGVWSALYSADAGVGNFDPMDFVSDGLNMCEIERRLVDHGGERVPSFGLYCQQKLELWGSGDERYRKLFYIEDFSTDDASEVRNLKT